MSCNFWNSLSHKLKQKALVEQHKGSVFVTENYSEAACRHFFDSEHLANSERWGNASHLVGFAAECAIKHFIGTLRPGVGAPHGHFPDLIEIARKHISSRRGATMHAVLKIPNLMYGWNVNLRYAENAAVGEAEFSNWRSQASRLFGAAGLKR